MQEFGSPYETEVLQNKRRMDACDLVCFVFDSSDPNSFAYVANLKVMSTSIQDLIIPISDNR
jgi:mitochondrial Rho GTPase 1